jgi:hypothetical protein
MEHVLTAVWLGSFTGSMQWHVACGMPYMPCPAGCSAPNAPSGAPPTSTSNMHRGSRACGALTGVGGAACLDVRTRVWRLGTCQCHCNNFIADLLFLSRVSRFCLVAGSPCVRHYSPKWALRTARPAATAGWEGAAQRRIAKGDCAS